MPNQPIDDQLWRRFALCRGQGPTQFYPNPGAGVIQAVRASVAVCKQCPSRVACLNYALDNDEDYGVWGGTTERQRRMLKRTRRRNLHVVAV